MTEVNNIDIVLYHYLRALSVKVSRGTVRRLLNTPLGDSIRSISDALDVLHVKKYISFRHTIIFHNWKLLSLQYLRWTEINFV